MPITRKEADEFAALLAAALDQPIVQAKLKSIFGQQLNDTIKKIDEKVRKLEDEIEKDRKQLKVMQQKMDQLASLIDAQEMYSRRTSIRISGITENPRGEDVKEDVLRVLSPMGITLEAINRMHRVGKKTPNRPRQVLVQFISYRSKEKVMSQAPTLLKGTNIFINEDLTEKRATLLYEARKLRREGRIAQCWSRDGRIMAKVTLNGRKHLITSLDDLAGLPSPQSLVASGDENDPSSPSSISPGSEQSGSLG